MDLAIIGTGHVGLVTAVCFAELGNKVVGIDSDEKKIELLKNGISPIYEPGLNELLHKNEIKFTSSIKEGIKGVEIIFICVNTPSKANGEADLSNVEKVVTEVAEYMEGYKLIVEKSTVPVQTSIKIKEVMQKKTKFPFDVASNPEFLREGEAIYDFMYPDRIVIGVETDRAKEKLIQLYKPIDAPVVITDIQSAELIKHASNSFLATKISFINAVALICDKIGANIEEVAKGMGLDKRIGKEFLKAGIGFGGSCFPKDLRAFKRIAEKLGTKFGILEEVMEINKEMKKYFVKKVEEEVWNLKDKCIGILGLSFKPNTEDMREAPSIDIIKEFLQEGAKIKAYDPQAMKEAQKRIERIEYKKSPYEAVEEVDCICLLTEWEEFKALDWNKIYQLVKTPLIVDGRNVLNKKEMEKIGFRYVGIGK